MTEATRFCRDCKHARCSPLRTEIDQYAMCAVVPAPGRTDTTDRVTGKFLGMYCEIARQSLQPCGPEGKLWEPIKPPADYRETLYGDPRLAEPKDSPSDTNCHGTAFKAGR